MPICMFAWRSKTETLKDFSKLRQESGAPSVIPGRQCHELDFAVRMSDWL